MVFQAKTEVGDEVVVLRENTDERGVKSNLSWK